MKGVFAKILPKNSIEVQEIMKKCLSERKDLTRNNKISTSITEKSGFFQIDKMTPVETEDQNHAGMTFNGLQGVIFQKAELCISTAVKPPYSALRICSSITVNQAFYHQVLERSHSTNLWSVRWILHHNFTYAQC
jgi:hypothetical protein